MYYSIPGVIKAAQSVKEVDYSNINNITRLSLTDPQPSRSSLLYEQAEDDVDANMVSKKTRVSFEGHVSVVLDGVMEELDREFDELSVDVDIIDLMAAIRSRSRSRSNGKNIDSDSGWAGVINHQEVDEVISISLYHLWVWDIVCFRFRLSDFVRTKKLNIRIRCRPKVMYVYKLRTQCI